MAQIILMSGSMFLLDDMIDEKQYLARETGDGIKVQAWWRRGRAGMRQMPISAFLLVHGSICVFCNMRGLDGVAICTGTPAAGRFYEILSPCLKEFLVL